MSIGVLAEPTWKPYAHPTLKPTPKPRLFQEADLRWADFAAEGRWEESVVAYLNVTGKTLLWGVINRLVAEARPKTRSQTRVAAREVLGVMMRLIRERRIVRHRRRWVDVH